MRKIFIYLALFTVISSFTVTSKTAIAEKPQTFPSVHKTPLTTSDTSVISEDIPQESPQNFWLYQLLIPLLVNVVSSYLVVLWGIKKSLREILDERRIENEIGDMSLFWINNEQTKKGKEKYNIVVVREQTFPMNDEPWLNDYLFGLFKIIEFLNKIYESDIDINIKVDNKFEDDIFQENVVLIGAGDSPRIFRDLCKQLDIPYQYVAAQQAFEKEGASYKGNFGSVVRIIHGDKNGKSKKIIIILDGTNSKGVLGSIIATTELEHYNQHKHSFKKDEDAQQLIISVKNFHTRKKAKLDFIGNWITFGNNNISEKIENSLLNQSTSVTSTIPENSLPQPEKYTINTINNIICSKCSHPNKYGTKECNMCHSKLEI